MSYTYCSEASNIDRKSLWLCCTERVQTRISDAYGKYVLRLLALASENYGLPRTYATSLNVTSRKESYLYFTDFYKYLRGSSLCIDNFVGRRVRSLVFIII